MGPGQRSKSASKVRIERTPSAPSSHRTMTKERCCCALWSNARASCVSSPPVGPAIRQVRRGGRAKLLLRGYTDSCENAMRDALITITAVVVGWGVTELVISRLKGDLVASARARQGSMAHLVGGSLIGFGLASLLGVSVYYFLDRRLPGVTFYVFYAALAFCSIVTDVVKRFRGRLR